MSSTFLWILIGLPGIIRYSWLENCHAGIMRPSLSGILFGNLPVYHVVILLSAHFTAASLCKTRFENSEELEIQ